MNVSQGLNIKRLVCLFVAATSVCLAEVPTPSSVLGHTPGDDFYLANYEEAVKYFHAMAASSDRIKMVTVGKSTQGRDIEVAITSPQQKTLHGWTSTRGMRADLRRLTGWTMQERMLSPANRR